MKLQISNESFKTNKKKCFCYISLYTLLKTFDNNEVLLDVHKTLLLRINSNSWSYLSLSLCLL